MNEEYERIAKLVNSKPKSKPNEDAINKTIEILEQRLQIKAINRYINRGVKEGYRKALVILKKNITDIQKADLSKLKTVQGRCIAALAIDYLKGECFQEMLCGVPIK